MYVLLVDIYIHGMCKTWTTIVCKYTCISNVDGVGYELGWEWFWQSISIKDIMPTF